MKPWLWVSPRLGHAILPYGIKALAKLAGRPSPRWHPITWKGLHFPNPLGVSGGLDKNAYNILDWNRLGAGFVEIGTVTPQPQGPNPGPIFDRSISHRALWNKMGFPNSGVQAIKARLEKLDQKHRPVLFVNVGKNRDTPNEKASEDYGQAIQELCDFGDVFVVNISSPNTKTLRELLEPKNLSLFLSGLFATVKTKKPILLKLSPDISTAELSTVLEVALSNGISGFILTNTLLNQKDIFPNHEGGGVSGVPLKERSLALLRSARETLNRLGSDALLVSVGGVMSYADIQERLENGAHLIQVYTAVVFEGPFFFRKMAQEASRWQ